MYIYIILFISIYCNRIPIVARPLEYSEVTIQGESPAHHAWAWKEQTSRSLLHSRVASREHLCNIKIYRIRPYSYRPKYQLCIPGCQSIITPHLWNDHHISNHKHSLIQATVGSIVPKNN